ncbi:MAG: hypothetical protein QOI02_1278 [Actinomycetota bacterium]|jgi:hypothetical protein|nr:hypothetical protein [Actinomycetota bacterium]
MRRRASNVDKAGGVGGIGTLDGASPGAHVDPNADNVPSDPLVEEH